MSHGKERLEKNCLNCNAVIYGRYCHICGQENVEPKETFPELVTHMVYDITHFDSKFFSTLRYLLFRPGYLTHEFIQGRRASYLHPVKMYVFTSAIFFLIFFTFIAHESDEVEGVENIVALPDPQRQIIQQEVQILRDSLQYKITDYDSSSLRARIVALESILANSSTLKNDSLLNYTKTNDNEIIIPINDDSSEGIDFGENFPVSTTEYDSLQLTIPKAQRDGFIKHYFKSKLIQVYQKQRADKKTFWRKLGYNFLHSLPTVLFISLPLTAFVLFILYKRRKNFLYVQHAVFVVHVYITMFILLLWIYGISALHDFTEWRIFPFIKNMTILLMFFYVYKAMRNFYGQSRGKTIFKFILFNFMTYCILLLLVIIFFFNSLINV